MQGGCACGQVRYVVTDTPLFVHACHCTWCQRETGSAFVMNAMIEADCVTLTQGQPIYVTTPSASGKGQEIARCPKCHIALWSHYASLKRAVAFVRVGTLDDPAACPPDVHIFTSTKQPWLNIEGGAPTFAEFYEREKLWTAAALARRKTLLARLKR